MGFKSIFTLISMLLCFNLLSVSGNEFHEQGNLETYIVHVELPTKLSTANSTENKESLESWYHSFLPTSSNGRSSLVYSYKNVFKGFAARLSPKQVKQMEKMPGFISAQPEEVLSLHTTHTPNFLGLHQNFGLWKESNYGKGIIVGVLDSGVNPDHPSFGDEGMPPPPAKWKGKCEFDTTKCNNKLIGARSLVNGKSSPVDEDGHGTHTASTAAGNFVKGANVFGSANGTAAGIAPLAHLAIYRVCAPLCPESAILAAVDTAIDDGVDILSLSLGGGSKPFYTDGIAISAYSAMEKGIVVSCSAGNGGPSSYSLSNDAPWILTVGASTIDRKIKSNVILGNGEEFEGESLYQPSDFPPEYFPLIYPGFILNDDNSKYCSSESLNKIYVQGRIVVCVLGGGIPRTTKGANVKAAGGVGMILINEKNYGYTTLAEAHVLPASHLSYADGLKVLRYIAFTKLTVASISFKGTIFGDSHAPTVAGFSSRGPSQISPGILKPDIIGPGVNILAAWHHSVESKTYTTSNFNMISGTSMACPHLSGVVALLKNVHPNWSPAAIKSAIMTTADVVNLAGNMIEDQTLLHADAFATGSGHVNPAKASDPGLIYDNEPEDYIPYLCGLYTSQQVEAIVKRKVSCSSRIAEAQLNYPSLAIRFGSIFQTYTRTVTNVGEATSSYNVEVVAPPNVFVTVTPRMLRFSRLNQKLTYTVTFIRLTGARDNTVSQGYLIWRSAKHSVRSPIVALFGATPRSVATA